jgi:hypothetical protein
MFLGATDMAMNDIFAIHLEGELDQSRLSRFLKLLNLVPVGRLTDTEDAKFGHRTLRDVRNEWVWLDLWRRNTSSWAVRLTFAGPRPADDVIAQCRAEVLGAASALGLAVTWTWPERAEPAHAAAEPLELPTRRALSVRLAGGQRTLGWLDVATSERLQRALHLRWELGGLSGTEFGWRYVHWDPPRNSVLLQLFDDPGSGSEVAVLFDQQPPSEEVIAGCRLQVAVAAAHADMKITRISPEPSSEAPAHDWAQIAPRAANVQTLRELLPMIGSSDDTVHEMTRGKLLAIAHRPEWTAAAPQLQRQVEDFLLGLAEDPA